MHHELPPLTPAQTAFLKRTIPDFSTDTWRIEFAGEAGSQRRFLRVINALDSARSSVLVLWDSRDIDWARFLNIAAEVGEASALLPRIYAHDADHGLILEEDLGSQTLCVYAHAQAQDTEALLGGYQRVIDALRVWQGIPVHSAPSIGARSMDEAMFLWESDYFATHCVKEFFAQEQLLGAAWHQERTALARWCAGLPQVCIHRDFQSENVLLQGQRVRFVDYQGARLGPAGYDLASLLYDPYVGEQVLTLVPRLLDYYNRSGSALDPQWFYWCAAQRLMQALGAYANLCLHKGKERYRASIAVALERLQGVLVQHGGLPVLSGIVNRCVELGGE